MYQQFFNFTEAPFTISPDPHFMFMSSRHQEGLAHLLFGINQGGGFVALTGEVGTGKTTLCQCLLQQLPDEVDLALVLNPKLSASDLLATICDELGLGYDQSRLDLKYLVDRLNHHLLETHARGRRTVLMIDEAQNLSGSVLEQIRLLTNLETHKEKLLQIILVGQPELREMLASTKLRQLNQRISARYHLLPLTKKDVGNYIRHRLTVSHGDPNLFKPTAIKRIHQLSGGIPRLINLICDRALLGAYAHDKRQINAEMVTRAAREVDQKLYISARNKRLLTLSFWLLLSVSAASYLHWTDLPVQPTSKGGKPANKLTNELQQPVGAQEIKPEIIPKNSQEQAVKVQLAEYLNASKSDLANAFGHLLQQWQLPAQSGINCENLPVNCLLDRADWRDLMKLNRPVILEFLAPNQEKRFLLLTGVDKDEVVFAEQAGQIRFLLHEVLKFWNGNFLMLWQPPLTNIEIISPGMSSPAVLWLREQLGVENTGSVSPYFDLELKNAVLAFQNQQQLEADGIAGPRTIIHLQNLSADQFGPRLEIID